jgi:hypothetical protein
MKHLGLYNRDNIRRSENHLTGDMQRFAKQRV